MSQSAIPADLRNMGITRSCGNSGMGWTHLSGWLSKGKNRRRRVSETNDSRLRITPKEICWWRVRGCLFVGSYIISISGNLGGAYSVSIFYTFILNVFTNVHMAAVYDYYPFKWLSFFHPILPLLALLSLLWSAWNPAYHSILKAQIQGRDIRVQGKKAYNVSAFPKLY